MKRPKSISIKELNKEELGYMQFSVTKEGYFRCGAEEDKYGADCGFRRYKRLESLARHWEIHHLRKVKLRRITRRLSID